MLNYTNAGVICWVSRAVHLCIFSPFQSQHSFHSILIQLAPTRLQSPKKRSHDLSTILSCKLVVLHPPFFGNLSHHRHHHIWPIVTTDQHKSIGLSLSFLAHRIKIRHRIVFPSNVHSSSRAALAVVVSTTKLIKVRNFLKFTSK